MAFGRRTAADAAGGGDPPLRARHAGGVRMRLQQRGDEPQRPPNSKRKESTVRGTAELDDLSRRAAVEFAGRARRAHLVDVGYTTMDTPGGRLLVATTRDG